MYSSGPTRGTLLAVYGGLLTLVVLTTVLSFVNLGSFSVALAMVLAGLKAVLVALYFMHLKYSSRLNWVLAGLGVYMLGILFVLTLNDVATRSWLSPFLGGSP